MRVCWFSDRSWRLSSHNGYNVSGSHFSSHSNAGDSGVGGTSGLLSFHQLHRGTDMEAAFNTALVYCSNCSTFLWFFTGLVCAHDYSNCTEQQFIHLLMVTCNDRHVENSKIIEAALQLLCELLVVGLCQC